MTIKAVLPHLKRLGLVTLCLMSLSVNAQAADASPRERLSLDKGWRFALGSPDPQMDFGYGTSAFVFGKDGYADGPASPKFDDRAWQLVDVPHDWAVALPFSSEGSTNHGSKAIGLHFPQNDIGWYRHSFSVAPADKGRRFVLQFDGVYRNATVWVNGHQLGTEPSGYASFYYDITDYLTYGADNVVVVRADASQEEGWFYEGAGIYRHVWLTKTNPVHVGQWGTYVTTTLKPHAAEVAVQVTVDNDDLTPADATLDEEIVDARGQTVARATGLALGLAAKDEKTVSSILTVGDPHLWTLDDPTLYRLITTVRESSTVVDRYETPFGMRTVSFDADKGFFLNGQPVKLKGLNNHQDAAGVGVALPDALQDYRLKRMKAMGANAYRTAHNPPTPEMLDAADRLGILILDENRQFGTSPQDLDQLRRLIVRDRNHPSVFLWSVGNEEWADEYSDVGTTITRQMQAFVKRLDPSRRVTLAMSSSNESGNGGAKSTDVMGFNYMMQHHIDAYHKNFPTTPSLMTEEGSTFATRGVYVDDRDRGYLKAYDAASGPTAASIQTGWNNVVDRPFVAGLFVWTGFDYRGETTPFGWPSISSQFGMMDTTGVFKDSAYYLKSWWDPSPMVHILPHWNWAGREGQAIPVWVYGNADEVELFLNGKSLGKKAMPRNGHLEWQVAYRAGTLEARGYRSGKVIATDDVTTAGKDATVTLTPDRALIKADGADVSVVTVRVTDAAGHTAPLASEDIHFTTTGPIKIIGVGNGDPSSHEADQFADQLSFVSAGNWRLKLSANTPADADLAGSSDGWIDPFGWPVPSLKDDAHPLLLLSGHLALDHFDPAKTYALYGPRLSTGQKVFINGKDATPLMHDDGKGTRIDVAPGLLIDGDNRIVFAFAKPSADATARDLPLNNGLGLLTLRITTPAEPWHRKVFNGYAQVLVQANGAGDGALSATADGLKPATVAITVK